MNVQLALIGASTRCESVEQLLGAVNSLAGKKKNGLDLQAFLPHGWERVDQDSRENSEGESVKVNPVSWLSR